MCRRGGGIHPQNTCTQYTEEPIRGERTRSPADGVQDYCSRFVQVFGDQDLAGGSVEPRYLWTAQVETRVRSRYDVQRNSRGSMSEPGLYLDPVRARVGPVQVAGHPVHGDAVGVVELRIDQGDGVAPVDAGAPDGLDLVVGPVHVAVHGVVVDSDGVPDVLDLGAGDSPVKGVCGCAFAAAHTLGKHYALFQVL